MSMQKHTRVHYISACNKDIGAQKGSKWCALIRINSDDVLYLEQQALTKLAERLTKSA